MSAEGMAGADRVPAREALARLFSAATKSKDWQLPPFWWAIIILPFLTFGVMNWMLTRWGAASLQLALPWVADGHAEAAGRLRTEASFLLYCGFAATTMAYVGIIVRPLAIPSRRLIAIGWAAALTAGVGLAFLLHLNRGDPYLENRFACASFE